jgi:hypothetical protein
MVVITNALPSLSPIENLEVTGVLEHPNEPNFPKIFIQSSEPDIPNNTTAYWKDTNDDKIYLILDVNGTQVKQRLQ